jgi:uncharacterized protein YprB with RNaseH-like and TPR domain
LEWTKKELKILKDYYPSLGSKVVSFLPGRTVNSVMTKAERLGYLYGVLQEGEGGYLDIETSGLQADFGIIYTYQIKVAGQDSFYHSKITREQILSGVLDKKVVTDLVMDLTKFKRIYTYYGTRFDIPFARSRALANNIDFVPYGLVEHRDIYYLARRILRIHSKRLESVCDLLGIVGKTHLDAKVWIEAHSGKPKAIDYILEHNKMDVIILEKVHKRLMEYEKGSRRFM